jgi:hypothetical protein
MPKGKNQIREIRHTAGGKYSQPVGIQTKAGSEAPKGGTNMKRIKLTQGKYAIVDDDVYERLQKFRWYARQQPDTGKWYAARSEKGKRVHMHRLIMNAPRELDVDHIKGDGLDNRMSNLRLVTTAQNRDKYKNNTTGYKGVSQQRGRRKFRAQIYVYGKAIYLGWYDTPREAALAYDRAVRKYHGVFGCTNFEGGSS